MSWDPSVLRKYNTTGHFRLLNQVRSELKANPLVRPKDGERIGEVNRSKALVRAIEGRQGSQSRGRRGSSQRDTGATELVTPATSQAMESAAQQWLIEGDNDQNDLSDSFRDRLNAVELR